jgi:hypothetical protein
MKYFALIFLTLAGAAFIGGLTGAEHQFGIAITCLIVGIGILYAHDVEKNRRPDESRSVSDNKDQKKVCEHDWIAVGPPGEILVYCKKCGKLKGYTDCR